MNSTDILLLNLPLATWYKKVFAQTNSMPPLGLLYVATMLKNNSYSIKVIDMAVEELNIEDFTRLLSKYNPKMVGMSTYNESWNSQKILCRIIKRVLPDAKIFAGGAFATFNYEDILNESLTDYVIRGEGDYSSLELCDVVFGRSQKNLSDIGGLVWKDETGKIIVNQARARIANLDDLPIPDRELVDLSKYTLGYTISTARGCPGDCIFCSSRAFWGKRVCLRSAESIFDEIMHLHDKFGAKTFYIADDTFTASRKRAISVCNMLKESNINFLWGCESRSDVVDEDLIKMLAEAGCFKIQFGMESGDNEVLRKLKKKVTVEQIENAVSLACKYNMHITVSFIVGHAFDTHETVKKTLDFARHLQSKYGASTVGSINTPFPGTEQYEEAEKYGIRIHSHDWNNYRLNNAIISTKYLDINQIRSYYQEVLALQLNNRD